MISRTIGLSCAALALAACTDTPAEKADTPLSEAEAAKAGEDALLPHKPLQLEEIEGKRFSVTSEAAPFDEIRFNDHRRFERFLDGKSDSKGEYVLTPDGRLCLVTEKTASSSCWRRLPEPASKGTIQLQYNSGGYDVVLTPLDAEGEAVDE